MKYGLSLLNGRIQTWIKIDRIRITGLCVFLAVSSAVSQNEQPAITLDHTAKSLVKKSAQKGVDDDILIHLYMEMFCYEPVCKREDS